MTAQALAAWARSGAMALTGRPSGPPLASPGHPALVVEQALARVGAAALARTGTCADLPDVTVLSERAAIAGFTRNAPWSCGGHYRAVRAGDGFIGLSLARPADIALVPALVEADIAGNPWTAVEDWARRTTVAEADERLVLLGLPGGIIPDKVPVPQREPVRRNTGGHRTRIRERPRIVDFSALWAGPLCSHLLTCSGAEVIKVESINRPDGARRGPTEFYSLLHGGQYCVAIDFGCATDRSRLARLVASADLVIEASRPRALQRLGLDAEALVGSGVSWLSITARGRQSDRVGFGDDIAAGAGLYLVDSDGTPLPCGDAIADPLTGVIAAAEASEALLDTHARLVDISMHDVAATAAMRPPEPHSVSRRGENWWVDCAAGTFPVLNPPRRTTTRTAPAHGAHTLESLL
ncbi:MULTISPECIES: CoA transferase [Nocardia]|uniref:CoA transferase n=1 Tax=Nocardia abscessus TaxID=120957 RepID=UPI002B4B7602|nr:CoA transferase [Nocardia abscessus]